MTTLVLAACFAACAAAVLVFLKLVADGIALVTRRMEALAEHERIAARQRAEESEAATARKGPRAA